MSDSFRPRGLQAAPCSVSRSSLRFVSIELVMLSNHLILCRHLLLLPLVFPSISIFSSESLLRVRWPKYWSFCFSKSPSNEYSGLISFRSDIFALLAVQGNQESSSAPQFESTSPSAFILLYGPLSRLYVTTGKAIASTLQTFVS